MGLSVSVFTNIEKLDCVAGDEELEDFGDYYFTGYVDHPDWKDRMSNLEECAVYTGKYKSFLNYGYGTHQWFREMLLKIIDRKDLLTYSGDVVSGIDWDNLMSQPEIPFYEFIWFSDSEGCIDWVTSEKLYNDFQKYQNDANDYFLKNLDDFMSKIWVERYNSWKDAFKLAAENKGVVVFD